jgi:hypothetical protein
MPLLGKGMLVTFTEVAPEHEGEFNEWYNREHIDERVFMPGFKRARRYLAADDRAPAKYWATYETETVRDLCAPEYMKLLGDQSPWSKKVTALFTKFERFTLDCTVDLTHGFTGAAGLARFFPDAARKDALRKTLAEEVLPEVIKRPGVLGACVLENDLDVVAEGLRAQGKEVPADMQQEWLVIFDTDTPESGDRALQAAFGDDRLASLGLPTASVGLSSHHFTFGNQR